MPRLSMNGHKPCSKFGKKTPPSMMLPHVYFNVTALQIHQEMLMPPKRPRVTSPKSQRRPSVPFCMIRYAGFQQPLTVSPLLPHFCCRSSVQYLDCPLIITLCASYQVDSVLFSSCPFPNTQSTTAVPAVWNRPRSASSASTPRAHAYTTTHEATSANASLRKRCHCLESLHHGFQLDFTCATCPKPTWLSCRLSRTRRARGATSTRT